MKISTRTPDGVPPSVEVTDMTKAFGQLLALDDVSITFTPGSFHAILGENGAGKSTLCQVPDGFTTAPIQEPSPSMERGATSPIRATPTTPASEWSTSTSRWSPI